MPASRGRGRRVAVALGLALAVFGGGAPVAEAQVSATAVRLLREGRDFRVRVRAALALGESGDGRAVRPLLRALGDPHPAVRAASAQALGRLGRTAALPSLRRLRRADREDAVRRAAARSIRRIVAARDSTPTPTRWGGVRVVVVLGPMHNRSTFPHGSLETVLARAVRTELEGLRGVLVLDEPPGPGAAREIQRRRLTVLRVEGSVTDVDRRAGGEGLVVRCHVSVLVMDDRGRAIRGELSGSARGTGAERGRREVQERHLARRAVEGAVESAMTGAGALLASARR